MRFMWAMINTHTQKVALSGSTEHKSSSEDRGCGSQTKSGGGRLGRSLTHSITTIIFHEERDVLTLSRRQTTPRPASHASPARPTRHQLHLHDGTEAPACYKVMERLCILNINPDLSSLIQKSHEYHFLLSLSLPGKEHESFVYPSRDLIQYP